MPKIPKDLLEGKIRAFENTHGKHKVVSSLEMARLQEQRGFEYKNRARLYRIATDGAIRCLQEISSIMNKVPDSYLTEIVRSRGFEDVDSASLKVLPENPGAAGHYVQMLVYAIKGLKAATPDAFHNLLMQQIQPFITTLRSVQSFADATNAKTFIPQFNIPIDLEIHEYPLTHN